MKQIQTVIPIAFFFLLSFIIVFPLFPPGFILTLDKVVTAKVSAPDITSTTFLFDALLSILNIFISSFWLQKILLFLIFFLSGLGMFVLLPTRLGLSRYFGGTLYSINPFVYERVMAGHWQLLLAFAILPFIIKLTYSLFEYPSFVKAVFLAVISTLLFNTDIHFVLIYPIFFVLAFSTYIVLHIHSWRSVIKSVIIFLIALLLLNANWIVFSLLGKTPDAITLGEFTKDDLIIFQSVPDKSLGLIFNLLSGYGFWAEVYDYFISPKSVIFFWPVLSFGIIIISLYGLIENMRRKEERNLPLLITLVIIFLIALDLAGGVALKPFENSVVALYNIFSPLRGLREPQKLVGIIMLFYAYFGSFGIHYFKNKLRKNHEYLALCVVIIPFIYTVTIFNGFWGQLKPVFYPTSWEKVEREFQKDKDDYTVLFFPWHQYMKFNFANNRVIANPARYYFAKPVLSAENYETEYLYSRDTRPEGLHVEGLLSIETDKVNLLGEEVDSRVDWAYDLAVINVKYIILAKTADWKEYKFLDKSQALQKISEDNDLIIYQNLAWGKEIPDEKPENGDILEPPVQ